MNRDSIITDLGKGNNNTEGGGQQARARKRQLRTRLASHMQHLSVLYQGIKIMIVTYVHVGLLDQQNPHANALTPFALSCEPRGKSRSLPRRRAFEFDTPEQSNVSLHHTDRQRYRLISRRAPNFSTTI